MYSQAVKKISEIYEADDSCHNTYDKNSCRKKIADKDIQPLLIGLFKISFVATLLGKSCSPGCPLVVYDPFPSVSVSYSFDVVNGISNLIASFLDHCAFAFIFKIFQEV